MTRYCILWLADLSAAFDRVDFLFYLNDFLAGLFGLNNDKLFILVNFWILYIVSTKDANSVFLKVQVFVHYLHSRHQPSSFYQYLNLLSIISFCRRTKRTAIAALRARWGSTIVTEHQSNAYSLYRRKIRFRLDGTESISVSAMSVNPRTRKSTTNMVTLLVVDHYSQPLQNALVKVIIPQSVLHCNVCSVSDICSRLSAIWLECSCSPRLSVRPYRLFRTL